jgi:uncharacterized membrane protein
VSRRSTAIALRPDFHPVRTMRRRPPPAFLTGTDGELPNAVDDRGAPVTFDEWMERVIHGFEFAGVAILVIGSAVSLGRYLHALARGRREDAYQRARQGVGRAILLGLEVLIIADIVLTVTVESTVESALTLGLVVLVRTFLSFSLEIELEGVAPWRRGRRQET